MMQASTREMNESVTKADTPTQEKETMSDTSGNQDLSFYMCQHYVPRKSRHSKWVHVKKIENHQTVQWWGWSAIDVCDRCQMKVMCLCSGAMWSSTRRLHNQCSDDDRKRESWWKRRNEKWVNSRSVWWDDRDDGVHEPVMPHIVASSGMDVHHVGAWCYASKSSRKNDVMDIQSSKDNAKWDRHPRRCKRPLHRWSSSRYDRWTDSTCNKQQGMHWRKR